MTGEEVEEVGRAAFQRVGGLCGEGGIGCFGWGGLGGSSVCGSWLGR